jgi:hypothetical protein
MDDPCPKHQRENDLQNELIVLKNRLLDVEEYVRRRCEDAWIRGVNDAIDGIPGGDEYTSAINAYVNRLQNPYAPTTK